MQRFQRSESSGDNSYAWELFRRALVLSDEGAWAGLYTLYERIVFSWVLLVQPRPHCFTDEEVLSLVGDIFTRFARNISATKFAAFVGSVPALLSYLKRCTRSSTFDALAQKRQRERAAREESLEAMSGADLIDPCDPAELIAEGDAGNHLWNTLLCHIHSPAERVVLYSIAADLSPGDVFKRYPALFASPADVYRIKRNLIDRCKRIPSLQAQYRICYQ